MGACGRPTFGISVASQNVTNKRSWYVLRVKNMHFGSPSDTWDQWRKVKLSYVHYIIGQGGAELGILEVSSVFQFLPSVGPKQLCLLAHLGCTHFAS